jgi:hypothetical protein
MEEWNRSKIRRKVIIQTFRDTSVSLPVDGSCDHESKIKGLVPGKLVISGWAHIEEDMGQLRLRILNGHLLVIMLSSGYRMSSQLRKLISLAYRVDLVHVYIISFFLYVTSIYLFSSR